MGKRYVSAEFSGVASMFANSGTDLSVSCVSLSCTGGLYRVLHGQWFQQRMRMCLQERLLKFIEASDLFFTDAHEEKRTPYTSHTFYSLVGCSQSCSRIDIGVSRSIHFIPRDRSKTFPHLGNGRRHSYVPVQESFGQRIHSLISSTSWLSSWEQESVRFRSVYRWTTLHTRCSSRVFPSCVG